MEKNVYKCTLHIVIASADPVLAASIRAVNALHRFTHSVTESLTLSPETLASGDIIILDMPDASPLLAQAPLAESLRVLQQQCKPTAQACFYVNPPVEIVYLL